MDCSARLDWRHLGQVTRDGKGLLTFPEVADEPGLFRFSVPEPRGTEVYIGESVNLRQRILAQFRARHPESTNVRIRQALNAHLDARRTVRLSVIYDSATSTSLTSKRARMDAKRQMIQDAEASGCMLLNIQLVDPHSGSHKGLPTPS